MKFLLLAIGILATSPQPHDYFVSILTIHHDPVKQALALTWKMTTHDVESAIEPVAGVDLQLGGPNEVAQADSLLKNYLLQHLHLSFGDSVLGLRFLGKEVEMENLFCYLEVPNIPSAEGLTVRCDLLQDLFADQVNEVNVETAEGVESHPFRMGDNAFI
ncbi:MAG TPA: DUF6702 family protein, partial [Flavobacteriales bacterium]|nr:DUF6702 family protein [Flavobacteriales bacterium]